MVKHIIIQLTDRITGETHDEHYRCGCNLRGLSIKQAPETWMQVTGPDSFERKSDDDMFNVLRFLYPIWSCDMKFLSINGKAI